MDNKDEKKQDTKAEKLKNKMAEHEKRIDRRMMAIGEITQEYPDMREMKFVHHKFDQAYSQRKEFGKELLKAKENCMELKSKVDEFLRQQNMLMIKLKGGYKKKSKPRH